MARGVAGINSMLRKVVTDSFKVNYIIENGLTGNTAITSILEEFGLGKNPNSAFNKVANEKGIPIFDLRWYKHKETKENIEIPKNDIKFLMDLIDQKYKELKDIDLITHKDLKKEILKYLNDGSRLNMSKNVINLGIDNGNAEIKVCYGENKTFKFDSKISTRWSEFEVFDNNAIRINDENQYYVIANAFDSFIKSEKKAKASKKPIFAFAIAKALEELEVTEDVVTVNICILNPVGENDDFAAIKEQVMELNNASLRYKTEEKNKWREVIVEIKNVMVLAEGIASYLALDDVAGRICLIDIGSKTTNYVMGKDGRVADAGTINLGTDNYFKALAQINRVDEDTIKELIKEDEVEHNVEEYQKNITNIYNEVSKLANGFASASKIILTGGGTALLENLGCKLDIEKATNANYPQFTNTIGAFNYVEALSE